MQPLDSNTANTVGTQARIFVTKPEDLQPGCRVVCHTGDFNRVESAYLLGRLLQTLKPERVVMCTPVLTHRNDIVSCPTTKQISNATSWADTLALAKLHMHTDQSHSVPAMQTLVFFEPPDSEQLPQDLSELLLLSCATLSIVLFTCKPAPHLDAVYYFYRDVATNTVMVADRHEHGHIWALISKKTTVSTPRPLKEVHSSSPKSVTKLEQLTPGCHIVCLTRDPFCIEELLQRLIVMFGPRHVIGTGGYANMIMSSIRVNGRMTLNERGAWHKTIQAVEAAHAPPCDTLVFFEGKQSEHTEPEVWTSMSHFDGMTLVIFSRTLPPSECHDIDFIVQLDTLADETNWVVSAWNPEPPTQNEPDMGNTARALSPQSQDPELSSGAQNGPDTKQLFQDLQLAQHTPHFDLASLPGAGVFVCLGPAHCGKSVQAAELVRTLWQRPGGDYVVLVGDQAQALPVPESKTVLKPRHDLVDQTLQHIVEHQTRKQASRDNIIILLDLILPTPTILKLFAVAAKLNIALIVTVLHWRDLPGPVCANIDHCFIFPTPGGVFALQNVWSRLSVEAERKTFLSMFKLCAEHGCVVIANNKGHPANRADTLCQTLFHHKARQE